MGTQQILMIVLSVIVVGAAVAVGIQMFDTQSNNQTRNAIALDLSQHAVQAQAWYRTPIGMGGGGYQAPTTANDVAFFVNQTASGGIFENPNGTYTFTTPATLPTGGGPHGITIVGVAKSNSSISATCTVDLSGQLHDSDGFERGIRIVFN